MNEPKKDSEIKKPTDTVKISVSDHVVIKDRTANREVINKRG